MVEIREDDMASQERGPDQCGSRDEAGLVAAAPLTKERIKQVVRDLTRAERTLVHDGCIHGDFRMSTVRNLKRKGLFYLKITSPNGQCGFMELTPLGLDAQALIKARAR